MSNGFHDNLCALGLNSGKKKKKVKKEKRLASYERPKGKRVRLIIDSRMRITSLLWRSGLKLRLIGLIAYRILTAYVRPSACLNISVLEY